jgi:hypothetical protein
MMPAVRANIDDEYCDAITLRRGRATAKFGYS